MKDYPADFSFETYRNPQLDDKIHKLVRERQLQRDKWTENMVEDLICQLVMSGDLVMHCYIDTNNERIEYISYNQYHKLSRKIQDMHKLMSKYTQHMTATDVAAINDIYYRGL